MSVSRPQNDDEIEYTYVGPAYRDMHAMTEEVKTALPPLPYPAQKLLSDSPGGIDRLYTADQMRDYAEAAVLSANAGKVDIKDGEIERLRQMVNDLRDDACDCDACSAARDYMASVESTAQQAIDAIKS